MTGKFELKKIFNKRKLSRMLFIIFAILVSCLILSEFGLRLYRWKMVNENVQKIRSISQSSKIIISLGESTTYGLWVDKEKNYSALLEKKMNNYFGKNFRVLNLGFCGAITDDVVDCFYDTIKYYKPSAVLVCMGVNDFSYMLNYKKLGLDKRESHPFSIEKDIIRPKFQSGLLLFKFVKKYFIYYKREYKLENWVIVEDREGDSYINYYNPVEKYKEFDHQCIKEISVNIEKNYKRLLDSCNEMNINLYIVGYLHVNNSQLLSEIARKFNIIFIDNTIPNHQLAEYTLHDLFHPSVKGHRFIADNILKKMQETWPDRIN